MDSKALSEDDFLKAFEKVVKVIERDRANVAKQMDDLARLIEKATDKMSADHMAEMKKMKAELDKKFNELFREQQNTLNFVRDKARELKNGKDADEDAIVSRVLEQLPEEKELTAEEVIAKVKMIGLEPKDIIGLADFIQKFIPTKSFGGGGTTDVGVKFSLSRVVKTETPTGDIDGANTDYTVAGKITSIINFTINGQFIHPSEYTISGNTISFATALDASLSGTSFTVTYV